MLDGREVRGQSDDRAKQGRGRRRSRPNGNDDYTKNGKRI